MSDQFVIDAKLMYITAMACFLPLNGRSRRGALRMLGVERLFIGVLWLYTGFSPGLNTT